MAILRKYRKGIIICGVAIISLMAVGYAALYYITYKFWNNFYNPPATLIQSSTAQGTAYFLHQSTLRDSSVYFYVRDPARFSHPFAVGNRPYGYATDGEIFMEQAVWSRDKSVIAVRGDIQDNDHNKNYGTLFVDAYDFKNHQEVGRGLAAHPKSLAIKRLLEQRGGGGSIVDPYSEGKDISQNKEKEFLKLSR